MSPSIQVHNNETSGSIDVPNPVKEPALYARQPEEKIIWSAQPSDARFFWIYFICAVTFWLVLPLLLAAVIHLLNRTYRYVLTTDRLRISSGFFVKKVVDLELAQIKEINIVIPIHLHFFGLGNLELMTDNPTFPEALIEAVPDFVQVEEHIRRHAKNIPKA